MNTNKVNAQNEEFFADLNEALDAVEQLPAAPLVLTATGDTFSAGIDLKTAVPLFLSQDRDAIEAWFLNYRETKLRLFTFPRPTIAAVNGHTFAGGLLTLLCCD